MVKEEIKMDLTMKIQIKTERGYQPLLFCSKEKAEEATLQHKKMTDKIIWPHTTETALVYGCSLAKKKELFFLPVIMSLEELIIFTKEFGPNGPVYAEYAEGKTKEQKIKEELWNLIN